MFYVHCTPPKFNSLPLTNGGWKTSLSYWDFGELLTSGRDLRKLSGMHHCHATSHWGIIPQSWKDALHWFIIHSGIGNTSLWDGKKGSFQITMELKKSHVSHVSLGFHIPRAHWGSPVASVVKKPIEVKKIMKIDVEGGRIHSIVQSLLIEEMLPRADE